MGVARADYASEAERFGIRKAEDIAETTVEPVKEKTMSTITADPTLMLVLSQMKDVTEIRDKNGNLVGVYTPKTMTVDDARKLFDLDKARERLKREGHKARPFREIIDKLERMETRGAAKTRKRTRKPT